MHNEVELTAEANDSFLIHAHPSHDQVVYPHPSQAQLALKDIVEGIVKWRIWSMLAYQDIKLRYRRSVLGPFWLTISMGITVGSMGYLYGHLFHMDLDHYYPFLVSGMLAWSLISTIVLEYTEGFSDGLIKQIKLPYSLFIHRIACRNIFIFFHNILVMVPIYVIFHHSVKINLNTLLVIPGLLIIYLNAISYGLILSMIGARYRDISQIIKSLIQVVFFITPVMWDPSVLGSNRKFIFEFNPFYALLQCVREPLLGTTPSLKSLAMITFVTLMGLLLCAKLFSRYRARIVYLL